MTGYVDLTVAPGAAPQRTWKVSLERSRVSYSRSRNLWGNHQKRGLVGSCHPL